MQKHTKQILGLSGIAFVAATTLIAHTLPPVVAYAADLQTKVQYKIQQNEGTVEVVKPQSNARINPVDVKLRAVYSHFENARYTLKKKTGENIVLPKVLFEKASGNIDEFSIPNLDTGDYILTVDAIMEDGSPIQKNVEFTVDPTVPKENSGGSGSGSGGSSSGGGHSGGGNSGNNDSDNSPDNNGNGNPYNPGGDKDPGQPGKGPDDFLKDIDNDPSNPANGNGNNNGNGGNNGGNNGNNDPYNPHKPYDPNDPNNPNPSDPYNPYDPSDGNDGIFNPNNPNSPISPKNPNSPYHPGNNGNSGNDGNNIYNPNSGKHFVVPEIKKVDPKTGNPVMSIRSKSRVCLVKIQAYHLPEYSAIFKSPVAYKVKRNNGRGSFALDFASYGAKSGKYRIVTATFLKDKNGNCSIFYPIPSVFDYDYNAKRLNVPNTGVLSILGISSGKSTYAVAAIVATLLMTVLLIIKNKTSRKR